MSADNTILIIKTKRTAQEIVKSDRALDVENYVYRVAEVQAAENLDHIKQDQLYNLGAYLFANFKDSPVFTREEDAETYAKRLESRIENSYGYVQYGIRVEDLSEYVFWGDF